MQLDPSAFISDPTIVDSFLMQSRPIACDTDRVIFRKGEPSHGVFLLQRGTAALTIECSDNSTSSVTLSLTTTAGSLLGLASVMATQPYPFTALARKDADLRYITSRDFRQVIESNSFLSLRILKILAAEAGALRKVVYEQLLAGMGIECAVPSQTALGGYHSAVPPDQASLFPSRMLDYRALSFQTQ